MALLPKGGIDIAGHKVPWEAIAALAGVAGVILVLRARSQGQNVASVGQAPASSPYTAASTAFGASGFSPDYSGALANISAQLTSLSETGINSAPAPAAAPAATTPAYTAGSDNPFLKGLSSIPVYSSAAGGEVLGWLPLGAGINPSGSGVAETWGQYSFFSLPISEPGGVTGYVHSTDITPHTPL